MKPEIEYVYNKLKRLRFDFNSSDFRDFRSYYRYDPELMRYVRKDDNDLFIAKDTFKPLEEELEYADKCHNLEEQLGCPLAVRCKVTTDSVIYDENGVEYKVVYTYMDYFDCENPFDNEMGYCDLCAFGWVDYKETWWLKEDKSE